MTLAMAASAQGNLLISGSKYAPAEIHPGVTQLPPGCTTACVTANTDGTYPFVFNNDNFRGLTISGDVVYYTKGSGGNGVDTVYFVDTTGKACPSATGLPQPGAKLPTSPLAYDPATLASNGLPSNMGRRSTTG